MKQLVTPLLPFPNITWWLLAMQSAEVIYDIAEHFEKRSYRNRYYITGANGLIQLTIPLQHGRNQRTAMQHVKIDNKDNWQVQHWRTLTSVYGRAPYFEHYAVTLEPLFTKQYDNLVDFNQQSILWLKEQCGIAFDGAMIDRYLQYGNEVIDVRTGFKPGIEQKPVKRSLYYQLFSERNGFYPNLSMLDMLFSEGPGVKKILELRGSVIEHWLK